MRVSRSNNNRWIYQNASIIRLIRASGENLIFVLSTDVRIVRPSYSMNAPQRLP